MSTVLEQDFTVEGKKGLLACPFSSSQEPVGTPHSGDLTGTTPDPTPHKSSDPICAAMLEETTMTAAPVPSKCPIRFLDKHSPEEIARYVETHKHEIPRSHEVCVRRYQRNEEQIRKLDAKYGSLVSMINDLSHLHRPMLPTADVDAEEVDKSSNKRVENWAQAVTASDPNQANEAPPDEERQSHFDHSLRDVRVGESPSRPWGITVPPATAFHAEDVERPASPLAAPVTIHTHNPPQTPKEPMGPKKCPFDHIKLPFPSSFPELGGPSIHEDGHHHHKQAQPSFSAVKSGMPPAAGPSLQPTFVNPVEMSTPQAEGDSSPQMVFNISGPVFIGYPMEQAMEFMRRFQGR